MKTIILVMLLLLVAACTSVSNEQQNTQISDNVTVTVPGTPEPQPSVEEPTTEVNVSEPVVETPLPTTDVEKVSLAKLNGFGTEANSKYYINRFHLDFEDPVNTDMILFMHNDYYNGTTAYNASLNCSQIVKVVTARSKYYGLVDENTICVAPPRDMPAAAQVTITGKLNGEDVFDFNAQMPPALVGTTVTLTN